MLRYFDNSVGKLRCIFYTLDKVEEADASHLFDSINQHFQDDILSYDHLVGLGTDGCNVMMGERNSVMSRLCLKQPALTALHCNCHIAALIANHACKVMPKELELTTDVWYYFHKSAKRMREFARFQYFVEVKPQRPVKQGGLALRHVLTVLLNSMMLCFRIFVVQMTTRLLLGE